MKKIALFFLPLIAFFSCKLPAQNIAQNYEIATWQGFRKAAISYTFDDGCSNQFVIAVPMFNELNYKATFFTTTSWVKDWNNQIAAANSGHEIANHTCFHPNLGESKLSEQKRELEDATMQINNKIANQKCVTMAYPYCVPANDSLCSANFIAVRGCQGFIEEKTPQNFMNISSIGCGNLSSMKNEADFEKAANSAKEKNGWLVYLFHGVDNDGGYSPIESSVLRASLNYLKSNDNDFWVATFGQIARYIRERNCTSISELKADKTVIKIAISDTLNNDIFNQTLTIRRKMPEKWNSVQIFQNNKLINSYTEIISGIKYISFEAIPDNGEILLKKIK